MSTGTEPRSRPRPYKFVQRMRDRHGTWRHYLRRPGFKRVALTGTYGSEEFAQAYRLAMSGDAVPPRQIGADRHAAGSLGHLIGVYKGSTHWAGLAANSTRSRGPILERLRTGPWAATLVRDLGPKHVRRILDDAGGGHAKKHWLKTMRGLFAYAIENELIEIDPSAGVKITIPKSDGYHTWTDEEIAQYRAHWALGSEPRLVLEFALETASRRCEVTRLGRQHVKAGRIRIARAKGCDAVDMPVSPELAAALAAMPATDRLTYLAGRDGQPYAPDQLGRRFAEWATQAGLPAGCRLHGLRKARTAQLASRGASPHTIMGITGHKSLAEVQRYADKFNRRQAADAAMALLLKTGTEL
jgi:integrase/recombinase XerD